MHDSHRNFTHLCSMALVFMNVYTFLFELKDQIHYEHASYTLLLMFLLEHTYVNLHHLFIYKMWTDWLTCEFFNPV